MLLINYLFLYIHLGEYVCKQILGYEILAVSLHERATLTHENIELMNINLNNDMISIILIARRIYYIHRFRVGSSDTSLAKIWGTTGNLVD